MISKSIISHSKTEGTPGRESSRCAKVTAFALLVTCSLLGLALFYFAARPLLVREKLRKSEAIIVLLGGLRPERIRQADNLFRAEWAPRIVLARGFLARGYSSIKLLQRPNKKNWRPTGKHYRRLLINQGVPEEAITLADSPHAYDTATEIDALKRFLQSEGIDQVILVTSASHSRRAGLIWRRVAPEIKVIVYAAEDAQMYKWWHYPLSRRQVVYEYGALLKELVRQVGSLFQYEIKTQNLEPDRTFFSFTLHRA